MAKNYNKRREKIQAEISKSDIRWKSFTKIITTFIEYGFPSACVFLSVKELSGKETIANIVFDIVPFLGKKNVIIIAFAVISILYGLWQRKLRYKEKQEMGKQLDIYQRHINPDKKSSQLTSTGSTNKEDQ